MYEYMVDQEICCYDILAIASTVSINMNHDNTINNNIDYRPSHKICGLKQRLSNKNTQRQNDMGRQATLKASCHKIFYLIC